MCNVIRHIIQAERYVPVTVIKSTLPSKSFAPLDGSAIFLLERSFLCILWAKSADRFYDTMSFLEICVSANGSSPLYYLPESL